MNAVPKILALILVAGISLLSGCKDPPREQRRMVRPDVPDEAPKMTRVERVFASARAFANGTDSALVVRNAFESLTDDELKELVERHEGSTYFAILMVMGQAGEDSIFVLEKALSVKAKATAEQLIAKNLMRELLKNKRPQDEKPEDRLKLIEIVLARFPAQINSLKNASQAFDVVLFNELVLAVADDKLEPILEKVDDANMQAFMQWAMATVPPQKASFKTLYDKSKPPQQSVLRRELLAHHLREPLAVRVDRIKALIDDANDWGLGADMRTDIYTVPSNTPAAYLTGTLLKVLVRFAMLEDQKVGATPRAAYATLREYALRLKARMGDAMYRAHVEHAVLPEKSIKQTLIDALSPTHFDQWAPYYLALEDERDVLDVVKLDASQVSNRMVRELYDLIIATPQRAVSLAAEPNPAGPRFIHHLMERACDADVYYMVDDFLTKASNGVGAAEVPFLDDNLGGGNKNAIQIAVAAGIDLAGKVDSNEDRYERVRVIKRLLLNDTGNAVAKLSAAESKQLATAAFDRGGLNGRGQDDFKLLYQKTSVAAAGAPSPVSANAQANLKAMRSELLLRAAGNAVSLQTFVDEVTSLSDNWGLGGGLASDVYELDGVNGTLLYVLAMRAGRSVNVIQAFEELRGHAKSIKARLGNLYHAHVTTGQVANGGNAVSTDVHANLTHHARDAFEPYYLAYEKPDDVYHAALLPENVLSNRLLRELYDKVIGDVHQLATDLAMVPGPLRNDRFLHAVIRRSAELDTYYLSNKFLGSLYTHAGGNAPGEVAERLQLNTEDAGGNKPLKNFASARPATDDKGKRVQILSRLLTYADANAKDGMTPVEVHDLAEALFESPNTFKQLYGFFDVHSAEARAMRSALLSLAYSQGSAAMKNLLSEFADGADIWGVRACVIDDTKEFELGGHRGSLFLVLVQKTIDDMAVNQAGLRDLRSYALIIKQAMGGSYDNYVANNPAVGGQTIRVLLANALTASGNQHFTNSFLGRESFVDVYDAAEKTSGASNGTLKKLYLEVIGVDGAKIMQLANYGGHAMGTEKFIHRLLERVADADTGEVVRKFIAGLNPGAALTQIKDRGTGSYPLQILADPARAPGDEAQAKVDMFTQLVAHDDGTTVANLSPDSLQAQRYFMGAGTAGTALFTTLYTHAAIAADLDKKKALRSALLNEAFDHGKTRELLKAITKHSDHYGLRTGIDVDIYQLDQDPKNVVPHEGSLLTVMTLRAIQTVNASGKYDAYKDLHVSATKLRKLLGAGYLAYAQSGAPHDAITTLQTELAKPDHIGLAEYYLLADNSLVGLNHNLVMKAANNAFKLAVFDGPQLKWLYMTAIDDDAKALSLANKLKGGQKFLHRLVAKTASANTYAVAEDFLTRLARLGAGRVADEINEADNSLAPAANSIAILADRRRKDSGVERNRLLSLLAGHADNRAFMTLSAEQLQTVLLAVRDVGNVGDLSSVVGKLSDTAMYAFAKFCAEITSNINKASLASGAVKTDNIDNDEIRTAFQTAYARLGAQFDLRSGIIESAFNVGARESVNQGIERVVKVVARDFLDQAALMSDQYKLFTKKVGANSNLLFVIIDAAGPNDAAQIQLLVATMKNKFPDLMTWQAYLDAATNEGGISIVNQVEAIVARKHPRRAPGIDEAEAKDWLSYGP